MKKRVDEWVQRVPKWMAPVIPGVCNVVKSFLRCATLIYISASVAEILIGGLELVSIVFAARIVPYPALLFVGMEGAVGVALGIILYYPAALVLGEDVQETWDDATSLASTLGCLLGLTLLFIVAAVFYILACAATSGTTRKFVGKFKNGTNLDIRPDYLLLVRWRRRHWRVVANTRSYSGSESFFMGYVFIIEKKRPTQKEANRFKIRCSLI